SPTRLLSSKPDSIRSRIERMNALAKARITELRGLLNGDVTVARAGLLKHVEKITLEPSGKVVVASGNWDLLGEGTLGWCRGPESNWLRPPFQGGALPMSYPGSKATSVV